MQHFIDATRQAVQQKNWYAALSLALTLPDICGRIQSPELSKASQARYVKWFDEYLAANYRTGAFGMFQSMKGGDLYALRCAYLHQGEFGILDQKARESLARFIITYPGEAVQHNNLSAKEYDENMNFKDGHLQLRVDMLCEEICAAVEKWLVDMNSNSEIQKKIKALGKIMHFGETAGHW